MVDAFVAGVEARLSWLPAWSISLPLFSLALALALTIRRIADEIMTRILVSAGTSPKVFDMRCEMREKLVAFLQREYPHALPRIRAEQMPPAHGASAAAATVQ